MKFSQNLMWAAVTADPIVQAALVPGPPFLRLDKYDSMVIVADLQEGLYNTVRDYDPTVFRNNIIAHASIAKLFSIPIVLTTSAQTGPNGPLPKEITTMFPNAPLIKRNGEVDAWDNSDFRAAVVAQNKSQIILAGITTDVCTEFLALSLRAEGYTVFANTEASGTFSQRLADDANRRMESSGVILQGLFAIVMDLMRDWRNTPGSLQLLPFLDQYLPVYGYVARAHEAAVLNGTLSPGELGL
ncbi:hypothetical protein HO173_012619 [Letharia columbiana]|uniref:Isochorismatase-like domain-containing protein n=1 Tax=Letharia columbiana TaxID=112416 RepID=A0A8H6CM12_9LECA|nr:uncharacterized protein HO173_012619 [Letharia columbiana]KAF6225989.1 hypothetical protein HO173_012619 [Letharia columbiana]